MCASACTYLQCLFPLQEVSAHVQGSNGVGGGEEQFLGALVVSEQKGDVASEKMSVCME